jgi:hypothetical protein
MFMTAAVEKIEMAFKKGTHIKSTGFNKIHASQEIYNFTHPEGGKQFLGCYPGSVKVRKWAPADEESKYFLLFFFYKYLDSFISGKKNKFFTVIRIVFFKDFLIGPKNYPEQVGGYFLVFKKFFFKSFFSFSKNKKVPPDLLRIVFWPYQKMVKKNYPDHCKKNK